jgi:hypothetical protein
VGWERRRPLRGECMQMNSIQLQFLIQPP